MAITEETAILRDQVQVAVEAARLIAKQKLFSEMDPYTQSSADFIGAYDICIQETRKALAADPPFAWTRRGLHRMIVTPAAAVAIDLMPQASM